MVRTVLGSKQLCNQSKDTAFGSSKSSIYYLGSGIPAADSMETQADYGGAFLFLHTA